jgi:hypothetical protein
LWPNTSISAGQLGALAASICGQTPESATAVGGFGSGNGGGFGSIQLWPKADWHHPVVVHPVVAKGRLAATTVGFGSIQLWPICLICIRNNTFGSTPLLAKHKLGLPRAFMGGKSLGREQP